MSNQTLGCAAVVGALAIGAVVMGAYEYGTTSHEHACTVTAKDRTASTKGGSDARIYTSCGVFQVDDATMRLHFDSADVYAGIQTGRAYDLTTVGWRVPILSTFPNVIEATPTR